MHNNVYSVREPFARALKGFFSNYSNNEVGVQGWLVIWTNENSS